MLSTGKRAAFRAQQRRWRAASPLPGKLFITAIFRFLNKLFIDFIGIAGMFRAPYQGRWKLAFDNKLSFDNGITIGAHACAFNASKGVLVADISPDSMRSLVGVQCNS